MKGKAVFLAMLLSVLLAGRAEAQRCLPKMRGIEMKAGMTGADGYWLGAALSSYARGGNKWVYGLRGGVSTCRIRDGKLGRKDAV